MIKFYTLFVALTAACGVVAQPTLVPTSSVQSIVEDFFVGNGIFVNNVTFNGGPVDAQHFQIAAFSDANNTMGIQEGILMTTGATYEVLAGGLSSDGTYYNPQDADVLALITDAQNIGEAAVLEFDFIATGDSVAFQYVFASTEYPEFVNTAFNDQFGFFISGPGIAGPFTNGATNLAVIPGTTTSVGINSVNDQLNSQYYIASDGTIYHGEFWQNMRHGNGVQYNVDGSIYKGTWEGNLIVGTGIYTKEVGIGPSKEGPEEINVNIL
jgi:hypothetical protein